MLIVGIDPSLSCTGVASFGIDAPQAWRVELIKTGPAKGLRGRMDRFREIAESVNRELFYINPQHKPATLYIEGYSLGSNYPGHSEILEMGGILRHEIIKSQSRDTEILEVVPTSLKKFLTNNGHAKKPEMRKCLGIITGRDYRNDDAVDAVALCLLGRVLANQVASKFPYMTEAAEKFRARLGE